MSKRDLREWALLPGLLFLISLVAVLARLPLIDFVSHDYLGFLSGWYDYITLNGMVAALADRFANYTPAYLYLMTAAAYLREFMLPEMPKILAVKLPSIVADFMLALAIYKLVQATSPHKHAPWIAYALTLFLPTVLVNSSLWGQADAIYSACIVACVWLLCTKRPAAAMLLFGLGAAFKAQSFFIAPLLAFLFLRRVLGIRHFAIAAATYVLMMTPAMLLGRPPLEALGTYIGQAGEYHALSLGLPNLYAFAPKDWYHFGFAAGLFLSAIAGLTLALSFARQCAEPTRDDILACAMLSVALMPFMLPKMHERYFFLADVMSIAAGFRWLKAAWSIAAFQLLSLAGYATILDAPPFSSFRYVVNIRLMGVLAGAFIAALTAQLVLFRQSSTAHRRKGAQIIASGGSLLLVLAIAGWLIAPSQRRPPIAVGEGSAFKPAYASRIRFGDAIELVGHDLPAMRTFRTNMMGIDLFFAPLRPLSDSLQLRVEIFNTQGKSLELVVQTPVEGDAPLDTWKPGDVYKQTRYLPVWSTVDAPQVGVFKISFIDNATGLPLPATCDGVPCDSKVGSQPFGLDPATVAPWLRAPAIAHFGVDGGIALLHANAPATLAPGQTFTLTTVWRQESRLREDLTFFVHMMDEQGSLISQSDGPMRQGLYPTSIWHMGEIVIETRAMTLSSDAQSGRYQLVAGFYQPDTLARVPVKSANSPSSDQTFVLSEAIVKP